MINELHKDNNDSPTLELNKGQRGLLCSNKESCRCPFLCSSKLDEDEAMDYLSNILIDAYLEEKSYEKY